MEKFLWEPSGKRKKESLLEDFSKYINKNKIQNNKLTVLEDGHYSGYTYNILAEFIFDELQNC